MREEKKSTPVPLVHSIQYTLWTILAAEMLFLLLPRTLLDLRVLNFFITANDQPAYEGQVLGGGILLAMMAVELFSLFTLWWLALRCTKTTIKEIPAYIWIGAAFSVAWLLNFVLPILWTLVAIPLFTTPKQFWMLQSAPLIVTTTAFAIMYWRGKQLQSHEQTTDTTQAVGMAESNGKQNTKWQVGLFAVIVVAIAGYVFMQPASKPYLTLEEAAKSYYQLSVKGAPFDIPLTHTRTGGPIKGGGYFNTWESPGSGRKEVDYINVAALLPDMSPYTVENAAEFDRLGWGKRVTILFGQEKSLNLSYIRQLGKMENSKLSGMLQYDGGSIFNDEFISQDYLISIRCSKEPPKKDWYPSCEVLRPYTYRSQLGNTIFPVFHLRYHFSAEYMQQWHEIDEKVITLFDRFATHAQKN
ncbi:MAG: hypothetical protein WAW87_04390 [Candidatus Ferrigenium altingense]